ncbi:SDR family NAD(P)-dependent oxidoreductase [uncultured Shewanella sp.]|uniref:SDR family NAD(P)-dependent oxidoreductase n=1 Tax=uncultured Shewanella sp. TaxID=173975 RepID=UPI00261C710C|nr:SDR family NAD(P)-dependent oxidoreductase [uncultured Shewanella sp.]
MKILITGATSGIGYELTREYSKQGNEVIACGRNQQKLEQLTELSPKITTLCFNLTDYQHYPQLDAPIDLLIFNAGDCEYIDNCINFDAKKFERVIHINLISIAYGLQSWLKHIKKGGRVVFISSSAALLPLPRAEAYGASKAALSYLSQTLAISLHPYQINTTLVHPGFVDTPLTKRNQFTMPMLMDSQQAAIKIIRGITKGKSIINFPIVFVCLMKLLRYLPLSIWQKIATRMMK